MLDTSTAGKVPVPNRPALETSRRELSEDVWFGMRHDRHPLGCRAIELGKPLQRGVTYTVVHGTLR